MDEEVFEGFKIEPLNHKHDRTAFFCGNDVLDRYLKATARQDILKSVAAIYVLTRDGKTIAGFYSLSQYSIDLRSLPEAHLKSLPRHPEVAVTLLGRFAIDRRFQNMRLGEFLLADALKRSLATSSIIASAMVIVDAKDETTCSFYEAHGFHRLREFSNRLVITMHTIEQMIRE